jgi:8-oxo-dGTP diphosphatase
MSDSPNSLDSSGLADSLLAPYAGQVRVRVGGLLLREGSLLLASHRGLLPEGAPFWSPPGGGWTFGESLKAALVREFAEETGLEVRVGRFLHLYEFSRDGLQALELFFEVLADDETAVAHLGHDPEHAADAQLLTELRWLMPRQLLALPPGQVHPVLQLVLSVDDIFVPQTHFRV